MIMTLGRSEPRVSLGLTHFLLIESTPSSARRSVRIAAPIWECLVVFWCVEGMICTPWQDFLIISKAVREMMSGLVWERMLTVCTVHVRILKELSHDLCISGVSLHGKELD
jgi:hypothetical protein